jgi:hypothetical protein
MITEQFLWGVFVGLLAAWPLWHAVCWVGYGLWYVYDELRFAYVMRKYRDE